LASFCEVHVFEVFLTRATQASPAFEPKNGDLKFIFKHQEGKLHKAKPALPNTNSPSRLLALLHEHKFSQ
jgi:hypothetical protein